ncbi:MAG: 4-alpha-glucanotransferase [Acetobacteraceae bacterium]
MSDLIRSRRRRMAAEDGVVLPMVMMVMLLVLLLGAIGLPAATDAEVRDSLAQVTHQAADLPPLVTAAAGEPTALSVAPGRFVLTFEDGTRRDGMTTAGDGGALLPAIDRPGYHRLETAGQHTVLAVAPRHGFTVQDAAPGSRPWALAVQLYALRRAGDAGLGDFRALQQLAGPAAAHGAAGIAISPVHAQFSADPDRYSPYSPSSRIMLNVLHAAEDWPQDDETARLEAEPLANWPRASRRRLAALRQAFAAASPDEMRLLTKFRAERGEPLETHARFEAIHEDQFGPDPGRWHWRTWPEALRHPGNPAVAAFAAAHPHEVALHAFMQMRADRSLAAAQASARQAGMPIGLIADLAVGADSGGSHCWSRQEETLIGLSIGAPPDLLSTAGQNWGLAAFSPRGLRQNGFAAFLEMLRSAMRHAGGVRIDHALGLARLWVVPDGASAAEGAYLAFPTADLLRLIALESSRHRAIVLGEDLGTIPEGFQDQLEAAGILGMRVLWFERERERFTSPRSWTRSAAAMTSTHDLPTVAGWWEGRDLEWRARLDLAGGPDHQAQEGNERFRDRFLLWETMRDSGAVAGDPPGNADAEAFADAATLHVAAACDLAIIPIEDALALPEQPNLPGTMDQQHPNWRRRLPGPAGNLLEQPRVAARLAAVSRARRDLKRTT